MPLIETLILKNCPKCQSSNRYWHQAGVFLVTEAKEPSSAGGFAQAAAVVCPDCGFIEFYAHHAPLLNELPEAQVPTGALDTPPNK